MTTRIRGSESVVTLSQCIMLRAVRSPAQPYTAFGGDPRSRRKASLLAPHMRVLDSAYTPSGGQPRTAAAGRHWRNSSDPRADMREVPLAQKFKGVAPSRESHLTM